MTVTEVGSFFELSELVGRGRCANGPLQRIHSERTVDVKDDVAMNQVPTILSHSSGDGVLGFC